MEVEALCRKGALLDKKAESGTLGWAPQVGCVRPVGALLPLATVAISFCPPCACLPVWLSQRWVPLGGWGGREEAEAWMEWPLPPVDHPEVMEPTDALDTRSESVGARNSDVGRDAPSAIWGRWMPPAGHACTPLPPSLSTLMGRSPLSQAWVGEEAAWVHSSLEVPPPAIPSCWIEEGRAGGGGVPACAPGDGDEAREGGAPVARGLGGAVCTKWGTGRRCLGLPAPSSLPGMIPGLIVGGHVTLTHTVNGQVSDSAEGIERVVLARPATGGSRAPMWPAAGLMWGGAPLMGRGSWGLGALPR